MRKILLTQGINLDTFAPMVEVFEVIGKGEKEVLLREELAVSKPSRYTPEEQAKIDTCNRALQSKGKDPLSEEEIDYMLDPANMIKRIDNLSKEMDDTENLQKLAGFKVEKHIVPETPKEKK